MKKNLFTILFLATIASNLFAQSTTTTDSLSMTIGTSVDVYYNLQTGKKDTVSNKNWHLAFAVRNAQPPSKTMQAATVLINEGRGVSLYETNKTMADWNTFDTTGWKSWKPAFNSDSSWDVGAFNKTRNMVDPFDYGWGTYNMTTRNVSGSKIYLIASDGSNPGEPSSNFRKICIQKIVYDTQWVFTISKLDGTDSNTVIINKKDFAGKLFAYYNIASNTVIDREPIPAKDWNLLFTRYKALVTLMSTTIMYPVMGVLQNTNTMAYKLTGPNAFTANYDTMKFIPKTRTIDWDWKVITTAPGVEWPIVDTTVYFTKTANQIHKIKFTKYYPASYGQAIIFNKTKYDALSVNASIKNKLQVSVYPNPASENLFVELDSKTKNAQITISDLSGKTFINSNLSNQNNIDISGLQLGMYMLTIATENGSETVKFIKQ
jgi:hypothetical protein